MLFRRGFVLRGDMVFVPEMPWKDAWLGLDGSVGRAVPIDALVSVATTVVPGDLLQKGVLVAAFLIGGWSIGGLVADTPVVARLAAVTLYLWNPWVLERLALGQWGFVLGYSLLPLVTRAAFVLRDDPRRGWAPTVVWLGASAVCTPSSGLMAALTALVIVLTRPRVSSTLVVLGGSLVVNLTWLAPSLLLPPAGAASGGQFDAFAARAESPAGVLLSVLSLGGVWKESIVPQERTAALVVVLSVLLTVVALLGLRRARGTGRGAMVPGLAAAAVVSVVLALLPAWGPVRDLLDGGDRSWPALGILRDSHRFLAPVAMLLATGLAYAVDAVWAAAEERAQALKAFAVVLVLWPILLLPSLAWGISGYYEPVDYPAEWAQVSSKISYLGPNPVTVVLPWRGGYRGFAWNDRHASLDPAPRFFPGEVLVDDRLLFRDRVLGSEDARLRQVRAALDAPDPAARLWDLGVTSVLLHKHNGVAVGEVPAGHVVHDGADLLLVQLADTGDATAETELVGAPRPWRTGVIAADLLAVLVVLASVARMAYGHVYPVRHIREKHREGV